MAAFTDFIFQIESMGLSDVVLPFILVFTIVFATLQKTEILGQKSKNFNVVVALVMACAVIIPHVTGAYISLIGYDPVDVLNQSLPQVSIIAVAIVMVMLLIGVFGGKVTFAGSKLSSWIVMLSFIFVFGIFGSAAGWFNLPQWLYFLNDSDTKALIIMILVFGLIIKFITGDEDDSTTPKPGFMENFKDILIPHEPKP